MDIDQKAAFLAFLESGGAFEGIEFDLYARNPQDFAQLSEMIPGLIVSSAGGMCPFQAEGLLHGLPFYFRERHDWATLSVGQADGSAFEDVLFSAGMSSLDFPSEGMFPLMMMALVRELQPASFLWKFDARKLKFGSNEEGWEAATVTENERDTLYGWGYTPEEGFLATQKVSAYLEEYGNCSAEMQRHLWELREVNPTPINQDNRVWPDPMPEFIVREA